MNSLNGCGVAELSLGEMQMICGGDDYQLWHDVGVVVGYAAHAIADGAVGFWDGLHGR
jgi:hypothetical protein